MTSLIYNMFILFVCIFILFVYDYWQSYTNPLAGTDDDTNDEDEEDEEDTNDKDEEDTNDKDEKTLVIDDDDDDDDDDDSTLRVDDKNDDPEKIILVPNQQSSVWLKCLLKQLLDSSKIKFVIEPCVKQTYTAPFDDVGLPILKTLHSKLVESFNREIDEYINKARPLTVERLLDEDRIMHGHRRATEISRDKLTNYVNNINRLERVVPETFFDQLVQNKENFAQWPLIEKIRTFFQHNNSSNGNSWDIAKCVNAINNCGWTFKSKPIMFAGPLFSDKYRDESLSSSPHVLNFKRKNLESYFLEPLTIMWIMSRQNSRLYRAFVQLADAFNVGTPNHGKNQSMFYIVQEYITSYGSIKFGNTKNDDDDDDNDADVWNSSKHGRKKFPLLLEALKNTRNIIKLPTCENTTIYESPQRKITIHGYSYQWTNFKYMSIVKKMLCVRCCNAVEPCLNKKHILGCGYSYSSSSSSSDVEENEEFSNTVFRYLVENKYRFPIFNDIEQALKKLM